MEVIEKKIVVLKALILTIIAIIGILLYDAFVNDFELIQIVQTYLDPAPV